MDKDDLIIEAGALRNSLIGLKIFATDHFSSLKGITLGDIEGLRGLLASIDQFAECHQQHVYEIFDGIDEDFSVRNKIE